MSSVSLGSQGSGSSEHSPAPSSLKEEDKAQRAAKALVGHIPSGSVESEAHNKASLRRAKKKPPTKPERVADEVLHHND